MARVLIVEPHADLRTLLGLVVQRLGHEPVVRWRGDDDPAGLDAGVIEVGDGSGLLAARRLRELGCPVVLMGVVPAGDEARAIDPAAYLVKPFPLHRLERALTAVLPFAASRFAYESRPGCVGAAPGRAVPARSVWAAR